MTTTNSALSTQNFGSVPVEPRVFYMRVPADLRFAVAQLVAMHDAGWEMCGFTGGGSGKVQFQKVEFRRRRDA